MKITLFRTSFWRAKAGTVKCKNCIRNLEKALDKTGKVGYTNQAVSGKRKQISGCSAVLVARLNGVQEAVSSILATRTKRSNDFATEVVGPFFCACGRRLFACDRRNDGRNKTQKICRICRISRLKLCISPNKNLENVSILRKNNRLCLQNGYRLVYFMAVKREK